jgi:RNA polymerase sigma-70 factor (ECF subfamily)
VTRDPELEALTDEELVDRFTTGATGAPEAFTLLMRRHEDKIFALALRMTGNRADALDATQDTFVQVFKKAGKFRGESAFGTWLFRVGINTCNDLLRKRKRRPQLEEDVPEDPDASPAPGVDEIATARVDISRALAALPPVYRDAVAMHDLGGLPYEDIAALTEVGIGTVKSRISRGRRRLAVLLEPPKGASTSKDPR